jgi:hypothetical protein
MTVLEFEPMDDGIHYQLTVNGDLLWIDLSSDDVSAIMSLGACNLDAGEEVLFNLYEEVSKHERE